MDDIKHGVIDDPRDANRKNRDYKHEDLFSGLPVVWTEKPESTWRTASQRNQDGSFSCVKQSSATALEVLTGEVISAGTYKLRADPTQGGMYLQNCGDLDYNKGTTFESTTPSQNMNDPQMDAIALPQILTVKSTGYRTFYQNDIDRVAEAIQAYGNCILTFKSNAQEWQITPTYLGTPTTFGHAICGIDYTLINGVKTIVCKDSAGQFSSPTGKRLITEDFLNKRCVGAMYYTGATLDGGNISVSHSVIMRLLDILKRIGILTVSGLKGIIS